MLQNRPKTLVIPARDPLDFSKIRRYTSVPHPSQAGAKPARVTWWSNSDLRTLSSKTLVMRKSQSY